MSIGLVCHFLEKDSNGKLQNSLNERSLQLGRFQEGYYDLNYIKSIYHNNLDNLNNIIVKIAHLGFKNYRMSSGLLPLFDKIDTNILNEETILSKLKKIGENIKKNNIRATFHPDHFVVLTSDKEEVINNSIKELEYHAWIMDKMELEESRFYAINIHGSGKGKIDRLISNIKKLPLNVRNRLTLENDERSANVLDLYKVYMETNTPICWDSHHHVFNDANLSLEEACELATSTWEFIKPLQHLSNTDPELSSGNFQEKRKHSDFVHYIPNCQLELLKKNYIDVDFEFKMKNIAIFEALKKFNISL